MLARYAEEATTQPNRGKRGIGIDLTNPRGLELLYKLVATADVFLTNFLPGAGGGDSASHGRV